MHNIMQYYKYTTISLLAATLLFSGCGGSSNSDNNSTKTDTSVIKKASVQSLKVEHLSDIAKEGRSIKVRTTVVSSKITTDAIPFVYFLQGKDSSDTVTLEGPSHKLVEGENTFEDELEIPSKIEKAGNYTVHLFVDPYKKFLDMQNSTNKDKNGYVEVIDESDIDLVKSDGKPEVVLKSVIAQEENEEEEVLKASIKRGAIPYLKYKASKNVVENTLIPFEIVTEGDSVALNEKYIYFEATLVASSYEADSNNTKFEACIDIDDTCEPVEFEDNETMSLYQMVDLKGGHNDEDIDLNIAIPEHLLTKVAYKALTSEEKKLTTNLKIFLANNNGESTTKEAQTTTQITFAPIEISAEYRDDTFDAAEQGSVKGVELEHILDHDTADNLSYDEYVKKDVFVEGADLCPAGEFFDGRKCLVEQACEDADKIFNGQECVVKADHYHPENCKQNEIWDFTLSGGSGDCRTECNTTSAYNPTTQVCESHQLDYTDLCGNGYKWDQNADQGIGECVATSTHKSIRKSSGSGIKKTFSTSYYNGSYSSWFGAGATFSGKAELSSDGAIGEGVGDLNVRILTKDIDLFDAVATSVVDPSSFEDTGYDISLKFIGLNIYSKDSNLGEKIGGSSPEVEKKIRIKRNKKKVATAKAEGKVTNVGIDTDLYFQKSFERSRTVFVSVVPVTVSGEVNGRIGVKANIGLEGIAQLSATITPYANMGAGISGGLGLGTVARLEVFSDFTFIQEELEAKATAALSLVESGDYISHIEGNLEETVTNKFTGPIGMLGLRARFKILWYSFKRHIILALFNSYANEKVLLHKKQNLFRVKL